MFFFFILSIMDTAASLLFDNFLVMIINKKSNILRPGGTWTVDHAAP